jgi:pimeloyl-ACP methyl ester carboxylesterase
MWSVVTRAAMTLAVLLVVLAAVGFGYERVMEARDAHNFPPPGRIVTVDGQAMHLACTGSGGPTVLMDAGLGGWSMDWSQVQPSLAHATRVCTYDRAGMGWSNPQPGPRDAQHAVEELHALLTNAGVEPPLILVGHSNGGLRVLLYAAEYRADVVGLVLVDPTPVSTDQEQFAALSPSQQAELLALSTNQAGNNHESEQLLARLIEAARPFGVARLLDNGILAGSIYPHLNDELQPAYRAGINRASYTSTVAAETRERQTSIDQVRQIGTLGSLPMIVLASSSPAAFYSDPIPPGLSGATADLLDVMLDSSRQAIAHLSANGRVESVAGTGHYIQFDRPDAVIQAVQDMVVAGR